MTTQDDPQGLLARMTLAEKIGQLNLLAAGEGLTTGAETSTPLARRLDAGEVGAIFGTKSRASTRAMQERAIAGSRLGIPLFFAEDVIHGHRTIFPLNIAQACSWDMELIRACAAFSAEEASSEGLHQVYAPMIDISRDPRWGRVAESPGEDPHLASCIAEAVTRGLQENNGGRVSACLKHFVAYGATQSGRDYDNATMAWEDLLDIYLPPFVAGVKAGAEGVMASFNAVNKMPMHAHEPLIEGWLRGTAGFDGLVVSDYTGVKELTAHGVGTPEMVVARALHAGIDMDMVGEDYLRHLPRLAEEGLDAPEIGLSISAAAIRGLIDRACLRVLRFKAQQGLFEDPYKGMDPLAPSPNRAAGRALARKAAAVTGSPGAGLGIAYGSAGSARGVFLGHTREEESAADRSGMRFMARAGIDPHAMAEVMALFAGQEDMSPVRQDPYLRSHPLSRDRIRAIESYAEVLGPQTSDRASADYWFARLQAKLGGYLRDPDFTFGRYPASDRSDAGHIGRALAQYKMGRAEAAWAELDPVLAERPDDAYLHELKGWIALESNRMDVAEASYRRAAELAPRETQVMAGLGRVLLAEDTPAANAEALKVLNSREPPPFVPVSKPIVIPSCPPRCMVSDRTTVTTTLHEGAGA
ncbi:glycoside hydrolase family 3 N-terminal domain-containing protein [Mangrovicoccus ximenensis]|uniref:glycoside hydrolase family 3 N-terminal domain-containing protein n=1 Tax=Mangrovicoccus ximenensis TaxID=1911570 RepID=UPI000D3B2EA8|nr:glycoside hydrolase family 3 N-terminal domain-containing protein [Mangrovicoccus ximenensis]